MRVACEECCELTHALCNIEQDCDRPIASRSYVWWSQRPRWLVLPHAQLCPHCSAGGAIRRSLGCLGTAMGAASSAILAVLTQICHSARRMLSCQRNVKRREKMSCGAFQPLETAGRARGRQKPWRPRTRKCWRPGRHCAALPGLRLAQPRGERDSWIAWPSERVRNLLLPGCQLHHGE